MKNVPKDRFPSGADVRLPYTSPRLFIYGDIRVVTQNRSMGTNPPDGATSGSTRC